MLAAMPPKSAGVGTGGVREMVPHATSAKIRVAMPAAPKGARSRRTDLRDIRRRVHRGTPEETRRAVPSTDCESPAVAFVVRSGRGGAVKRSPAPTGPDPALARGCGAPDPTVPR